VFVKEWLPLLYVVLAPLVTVVCVLLAAGSPLCSPWGGALVAARYPPPVSKGENDKPLGHRVLRRTMTAVRADVRMVQTAHGQWSGLSKAPWSGVNSVKSQKKLDKQAELTSKLAGAYGIAGAYGTPRALKWNEPP